MALQDRPQRVRRRALRGELPPAIEAMLWHYAKGKPKETLDLRSDDDLLARLDRGRQRVAAERARRVESREADPGMT